MGLSDEVGDAKWRRCPKCGAEIGVVDEFEATAAEYLRFLEGFGAPCPQVINLPCFHCWQRHRVSTTILAIEMFGDPDTWDEDED